MANEGCGVRTDGIFKPFNGLEIVETKLSGVPRYVHLLTKSE